MTEMLLNNKYEELGVPILPHMVIYVLLLTTAGGLVGAYKDCGTMAKVVSILLAGHGALLFANPRIDGELSMHFDLLVVSMCCALIISSC